MHLIIGIMDLQFLIGKIVNEGREDEGWDIFRKDYIDDEDGNENIYVKSYDPFAEKVKMEDIETDAEWNMVSEVLNSIKNGEV